MIGCEHLSRTGNPRTKEHAWGCLEALTMDAHTAEVTANLFLPQIRERLDNAASVARAAEACANAGNIEKAIEIVLDVEQGIYEVTTLLNGASLIIRIAKN
jgi:hypothetical protein